MSISELTIFHFSWTRICGCGVPVYVGAGRDRRQGIVICRLRDRIFTVRLTGHSAYKRTRPLCIF